MKNGKHYSTNLLFLSHVFRFHYCFCEINYKNVSMIRIIQNDNISKRDNTDVQDIPQHVNSSKSQRLKTLRNQYFLQLICKKVVKIISKTFFPFWKNEKAIDLLTNVNHFWWTVYSIKSLFNYIFSFFIF